MSSATEPSAPAAPRGRRHPGLHLLWVVPAVVVFCFVPWVVAALSWCGISGCTGGGFGRTLDGQWMAILACCIAAAALAIPLLFIPWVRRRSVRIPVAVVSGLAWGYLIAVVSHGEGPWFTP
ncbi:hypothetical protein [Leifsonia shinshuensis]